MLRTFLRLAVGSAILLTIGIHASLPGKDVPKPAVKKKADAKDDNAIHA